MSALLSEIIEDIGTPAESGRHEALVGAFALSGLLLEIAGPLIGYPTVTGSLYSATGATTSQAVPWQMLLLLAPQMAAAAVVGRAVSRSAWGRWIGVRLRGDRDVAAPEVHPRETLWGALGGLTVWFLLDLQFGALPDPRRSLIVAETFLAVLGLTAVLVGVVFRPRLQFNVTDTENRILWIIPRAPQPVEIVLDPTAFLKSIVLRVVPGGFVLADTRGPLRLDEAELVLLNLGVLESTVGVKLQGRSANVLQCTAQLTVSIAPPERAAVLDRQAVDYLLKSLYTKSDLIVFFNSQLALAMDQYAGEYDSSFKTLTESLELLELRGDARLASETAATGVGPIGSVEAEITALENARARAQRRLTALESFSAHWEGARRLQERGKSALPPVFDRQLRKHFRQELATLNARAWGSAEVLLNAARIGVQVVEVEFTDRAVTAERTVPEKTAAAIAELRAAEAALLEVKTKRKDELLALIDHMIRSIDSRLLLTPRGTRLVESLLAMRMEEWSTAIRAAATALPDETPAAIPPRKDGGLRIGRGLSRPEPAPVTPTSPAADASAAKVPDAVPAETPASKLRFGPTRRTSSGPPPTSGASARKDEEPM
jgi:hypothetical protein